MLSNYWPPIAQCRWPGNIMLHLARKRKTKYYNYIFYIISQRGQKLAPTPPPNFEINCSNLSNMNFGPYIHLKRMLCLRHLKKMSSSVYLIRA